MVLNEQLLYGQLEGGDLRLELGALIDSDSTGYHWP